MIVVFARSPEPGPPRIEVDEATERITLWDGPRRRAPGAILDEPDPEATAKLINEHPVASKYVRAHVTLGIVAMARAQTIPITLGFDPVEPAPDLAALRKEIHSWKAPR